MSDYDILMKKYPLLYQKPIQFCCGPGWYNLIDDLSKKLEEIIKKEEWGGPPPCVNDVKEKHGTLRFYLDSFTDSMEDLIEEAEDLSGEICEVCGDKAQIGTRSSWCFTRCGKCP